MEIQMKSKDGIVGGIKKNKNENLKNFYPENLKKDVRIKGFVKKKLFNEFSSLFIRFYNTQ